MNSSPLKYLEKFQNDYEIVMKAAMQNGISLGDVSLVELKSDKQIIQQAVKSNGRALMYVPKELIDRDLVMSALETYPNALKYAPMFNNDKELVTISVKKDYSTFDFVSIDLKNDREFCIELLKLNSFVIGYVSDEFQNDREMAMVAVESDPRSYFSLPKNLRNDREIAQIASGSFTMFPDPFSSDREFIKKAIFTPQQVFNFIEYSELANDNEFFLELIESNCNYRYITTERILNDQELMTSIIKIDPSTFNCATREDIRANKQLVMNALCYELEILENVSEELKNDRQVIELAIRMHDGALVFASNELKNCRELVAMAMEYDPMSFEFASEELKLDRQLAEMAILNDVYTFEHAPEELRNDIEFCQFVCSNSDYFLAEYFGEIVKKERDLMMESYKKKHAYLLEEFKYDKEIVFESVTSCGDNIVKASFDLKNYDKELLIVAVRNGCGLLGKLDRNIIDREIFTEYFINYGFDTYEIDKWTELIDEKMINFQILSNNVHWFQFFNLELRSNKDFVRKYVKNCGEILQFVSDELKNDKEIILDAITNNPTAYRYASEALKNDRDVLKALKQTKEPIELSSIKERETALQVAEKGFCLEDPIEFKNDKEVALKTVSVWGSKLGNFSFAIRKDREIVLQAVKKYSSAIEYSGYDYRYDKDFIIQSGLSLRHVIPALRNDRDLVLKILENPLQVDQCIINGVGAWFVLEYYVGTQFTFISDELKEEFKSNEEIMLKAIKYGPAALIYACEELQNDSEFLKKAAQANGMVLRFVPVKFKHDREIVLEAVQQNGYSLRYAALEFKNDREIVKEAVNSCVGALEFASYKLKNEKEFILEMTRLNYHSFYYASSELQRDEDVISQAMEINIETLRCASYSLRYNIDFLKRMNKDNRLVGKASIILQKHINIRGLLGIEENDPKKLEKLLDFLIERLEKQVCVNTQQ